MTLTAPRTSTPQYNTYGVTPIKSINNNPLYIIPKTITELQEKYFEDTDGDFWCTEADRDKYEQVLTNDFKENQTYEPDYEFDCFDLEGREKLEMYYVFKNIEKDVFICYEDEEADRLMIHIPLWAIKDKTTKTEHPEYFI